VDGMGQDATWCFASLIHYLDFVSRHVPCRTMMKRLLRAPHSSLAQGMTHSITFAETFYKANGANYADKTT